MTSKKISQFTQVSSFEQTDLVNIVRSSTNYSVPFSAYSAALGVTGSINVVGGTGMPVLEQPSGTVNNIRTIENGNGILASISAQNGITISQDITLDTTGAQLVVDKAVQSPVFRSVVGSTGISVIENGNTIEISTTFDPSTGLANRIVCTEASDLAGSLDSTKEYFIDGIIDMGSTSIEVPQGGLSLTGYSFDTSKLMSSANNYTMFTSPVSGSGNVLGRDYSIEVTGTSSQVYDLVSDTGSEAFEFARINYNNCTSLGEIDNYRQGLEVGTGRFGGTPNLTLTGAWVGGYSATTSIVRSLDAGMTGALFQAGADFLMSSRFRTDMNVDLPASAALIDFSTSNFTNPSTVQLFDMIISRNGVFDASDANITPNLSSGDLVCDWNANVGINNTFVGGTLDITTEIATTVSATSTFYDLAGTYTAGDLQHFDSPSNGQLRHLGSSPTEYKVTAEFILESAANDDIRLKIVKWDNSATGFVDVYTQARQVNSLSGGRNVAFFTLLTTVTLDQNDYIKLQVANITSTTNITAELDSLLLVEKR